MIFDKYGVVMKILEFILGLIMGLVLVLGIYEWVVFYFVGIGDIINGMVIGMIEVVDIIVFIFVLGGFIGVVKVSGVFEVGFG